MSRMLADGTVVLGTKFPTFWAALSAPFDPRDVKTLAKGGKTLRFATARVYMNRLDEIIGPEDWTEEYVPGESSVLCKLTVTLPDGTTVTKSDAGGYAGMADQGDDDKSGYSDSFKRACVKLGVGRYLYNDGTAHYGDAHEPAPAHAAPRSGKALFAWCKDQEERTSVGLLKYLNGWAKLQEIPGRMVDWDADQVNLAYAEACRKLASVATPEGDPAELKVLRREFVTLARDIDRKVHDDVTWQDDVSLASEVNVIANLARPGWKVLSIQNLTDPEAFRQLIAAAKQRQAEVGSL